MEAAGFEFKQPPCALREEAGGGDVNSGAWDGGAGGDRGEEEKGEVGDSGLRDYPVSEFEALVRAGMLDPGGALLKRGALW